MKNFAAKAILFVRDWGGCCFFWATVIAIFTVMPGWCVWLLLACCVVFLSVIVIGILLILWCERVVKWAENHQMRELGKKARKE